MPKTACIYFLPKLILESDSYQIDNRIKISDAKNAKESEALFKIVEEENLTKVGDPSSYDICLTIDHPNNPFIADYTDPYFLLNQITNFLAINTFSPVVEGNAIRSQDDFKTAEFIGQFYDFSHAKFEYFNERTAYLSHNNIHNVRKSWQNFSRVWEKQKSQGRLSNALTYYYYSWNSPYLEPICINLAVVFELLFAPHSQSEITHQISYNVAHFVAEDSEKREEIYRLMKKFYGKRSSILHGGLPSTEKLVHPTTEAFKLCSKILRNILVDEELVQIFDSENDRKELMKSFLF
jgi:hypothetical protein